jgi:3-oxoacyl-[acyl-carrier-protein] synthase II
MNRRVVISGIGAITPIGATTRDFWCSCLDGRSAVAPIPHAWTLYAAYGSTIWAPLPLLDFSKWNIGRIEKMQLDKSTMIALGAAAQALDDARLHPVPVNEKKNTWALPIPDPTRCGVFMGTGIGGLTPLIWNQAHHTMTRVKAIVGRLRDPARRPDGSTAELLEEADRLLSQPSRFNPFTVSMIMPNALSSMIGIRYSLNGPNTTYCCACASGTVALGQAFRAVRSGAIDMAIAGGAEYLADDFGGIFRGFDAAKTLASAGSDPLSANRPFDTQRTGFLFCEGAGAVLVLETPESAAARKAPVYAEIAGYAESCDGYNIMIMDPQAGAITRMLRELLDGASYAPADIDYINAHGTGTLVNDEIEAGIIESLFGKRPLVNSTKSLIGHSIGAAGALEAAVTALSIRHKTTHACKNLSKPIRDLNFVRNSGQFNIRRAITQSFAFGGHNAALLLQEAVA